MMIGMGKGVIIGFMAALIVVVGAVYCYFVLGFAPVATAAQPIPFETYLAKHALNTVVAKHANTPSPVDASEANLTSGATVFIQNCAVCHGLPGKDMTGIAMGMFPKPPQLFKGKGVTDDPVGETFWKVQNGIRLTGMPGFGGYLTDQQIWQVSQLLAHANELPASARDELARANPQP